MENREKIDALRHIKLGIKEVYYYNYEGDPLPLRPISSYELDDCFYKALRHANSKVFDLVVKLRLKLIDKNKEVENFENKDYISLQQHYDSLSYWVVYHSMKDFQNEDFVKPTIKGSEILPEGMFLIRQMNYIHEIAQCIIDSSYKPKEVVKEIILDDGKEVAYCVFYLNTPLANIGDITKLQRDYLLYSKGEIIGRLNSGSSDADKKKQYIVSGQKMTMSDVIKRFYGKDVLDNIKLNLDKKGEANTPFGHIKIDKVIKKIEESQK